MHPFCRNARPQCSPHRQNPRRRNALLRSRLDDFPEVPAPVLSQRVRAAPVLSQRSTRFVVLLAPVLSQRSTRFVAIPLLKTLNRLLFLPVRIYEIKEKLNFSAVDKSSPTHGTLKGIEPFRLPLLRRKTAERPHRAHAAARLKCVGRHITMLGRLKRWVLAMLANAARGSVPGFAAFDPSCAWRSSEPVGTKGVHTFSPRRLRRGSNKGPV